MRQLGVNIDLTFNTMTWVVLSHGNKFMSHFICFAHGLLGVAFFITFLI